MKKPKKSVEERIKKDSPEFVAEVVALSVDELNARVLTLTKELEQIEETKEEDVELQSARELVAEYSGPYNEGKRVAKLRTKYLIQLIKEKGGVA